MLQLASFLAITLAIIRASVAIQVTSPNADSVWNLKEGNTITWTTVSTDPTTFNLVLVNKDPNCAPTGMSQTIKENISTADGKSDITGLPEVKECGGYQINLVSPNNSGILAQSAPFHVSNSGQSTSSSNYNQYTHNNGTTAGGGVSDSTMSSKHPNSSPSLNSQNISPSTHSSPNTTTGITISPAASSVAFSLNTLLVSLASSALFFLLMV